MCAVIVYTLNIPHSKYEKQINNVVYIFIFFKIKTFKVDI